MVRLPARRPDPAAPRPRAFRALDAVAPAGSAAPFGGHLRGRYLLALDLVGIAVASYLALALRFDQISGPLSVPAFPAVVVLLLATRTIVNINLGLYSRRWRNASVPDLERIAAAVALGSLISIVIFYGASAVAGSQSVTGFPRSFWPIEALLSVAILGGVRFGIRAASEHARPSGGVTPPNGQRGAAVRRRPGRGPAGPLRPAASGGGRQAGRVPR